MAHSWPFVPLGEVLAPVSRPEPVEPDRTHSILGAHWYAKGLYTKEITTGAGVQANNLYRVERGDFDYTASSRGRARLRLRHKRMTAAMSQTSSRVFDPTAIAWTPRFYGSTSAALHRGTKPSR